MKVAVAALGRGSRKREILEVIAIPLIVMFFFMAYTPEGGLVLFGLLWVAPAWIACVVALNKDRGRWWGFWLGWFGVFVAAAIGPGRSHEMNELELRHMELQVRDLERRVAENEPHRIEAGGEA